MTQLVTIFGGSGFVGRYIAQRMAKAGWRVRVAVRRPNEAGFVRTYGAVGQVEPILCNVRDDASVQAALKGADVAVNCVGILAEDGRNTFDAVQASGAKRIAQFSAAEGVARLVHVSAIGADATSESAYAQTKAAGEEAVLRHMPGAVILRPSIIFGPEDDFFNRFGAMARTSPVIPLVGADTQFQPVYVDDVAAAAEQAILGQAAPGIYELGGPDVATFKALIDKLLGVIHRTRLPLPMPFWAGRMIAGVTGVVEVMSLGIVKAPLTTDQVKNLANDNVVSGQHGTFADLGIEPTDMDAVLPEYLWRFRPSGQYSEIKESAKNLRQL